jgi:signal transduction histidine kinase
MDIAQHLQRVREDERGHLARELHDELGGLLTTAKLDIARVRKRVEGAGVEVAETLQHLGQTLDAGIALKRRIIEDLRPSSLDSLGLQRTLELQCEEFAQRAELRVQAQIADLKLDPERALAVYRVLQEALTNIAKYAQASEVRVLLQQSGERALLRVADNGRGFDVQQERKGSHGLAGMRFRMRSCGGDFVLRSLPGQGTTIEATLPL